MKKILIEKVTACPFEDYKKNRTGYSYCVDRTEIQGEDEVNKSVDWIIYPNGTFESWTSTYYTENPPEHGGCEGTFDKSLYDSFVSQMEQGQVEWQDKLQFNDDSWYVEG